MAYNTKWNPDALPAHPEPEQAAQAIAYQKQQQNHSNPPQQPPPNSPSRPISTSPSPGLIPQPLYANKPAPPLPRQPGNHQQAQQQIQQRPQQQTHQQPPPIQPVNYRHAHSQNPSTNFGTAIGSNGGGILSPSSMGYDYGSSPQPAPVPGRPPSRLRGASQPSIDPVLYALFKAVDRRGAGQLTDEELGAALVNGDYTSFDPHTVKMMIRMFDTNRSGSIGFDEFTGLWGFLAAWRSLFDRFDTDRSGTISYQEYSNALLAFGYHLSPEFVLMLYRAYDKWGTNDMSFDIFVQSCISLKRMTDVFKKYDSDRDGFITLSFEDFLTEILLQR